MIEYRFAIVDDEKQNIDLLKSYFKRYEVEKGVMIKVDAFKDGLYLVDKYKSQYNIIFLDIEMKYLNGLEVAKKIRKIDQNTIIVFITNLAQYAVNGYEVEANSFLVKPIQYRHIEHVLNNAIKKVNKNMKQYLLLNLDVGIRKIEVMDIIYIESVKHILIIHTTTGDYSMWSSMKDMEKKLASYPFQRCNVSYIVNLARIKGVNKDSVILNEKELKISRNKKTAFMEALADYYKGEI